MPQIPASAEGPWEVGGGRLAARRQEEQRPGTQERTRDLWAAGLPGGRRREERREGGRGEGRRERPSRNVPHPSQGSTALLLVA